ncbi:glycosyltransferase family 2 protein [Phytohalomonas tamaricis]|uniref:glycosyltransferase family 2 protein n=1 Tax=Phytohalomonas tamaricis TaxID=2081032 RepID=UPI0021D4155D|nr:glycosyltransferase family 2 protein [Phytohalomonas tamaricis]
MNELISLVVPVKDEEDAIDPFLEAITDTLFNQSFALEILFVDDGSTDRTIAKLEEAAERDSRVRYLKLSRNFGKEPAMSAGLDYATGDAVVPMDVDLQDPPELIIEFVRLWREGYDTVYGVRSSRDEDTKRKRASAGMFYRLFNSISHTPIPSNAGDFRLLDRRVVEALKRLPERNRFMKGLFSWPGYRSVGVPYARPARQHGTTKFNYWKLWNFALDGFTGFSTIPLRVWTYVGGIVAVVSLLYMLIIILKTIIFGVEMPGYASLMSAVLFLGAMQLISIGVLGEYIGRLFIESKRRPLYLVEHDSKMPGSSPVGAKHMSEQAQESAS